MILDDIVNGKKIQLKAEMSEITIEGWKQRLKRPGLHSVLDFYKTIKQDKGLTIIGEVKKASPSKGIIREDFDPLVIARDYYNSNIKAISVLTEKNYFQGSDNYLMKIRQSFPLPILRKDFIIDTWQIFQSRYLGADAILLITSILSDGELVKFQAVAGILGLQCLVEVHTTEEARRAVDSGAMIIGINNRNLKTFEVNLKTTEEVMNIIPHDRAVVSESGINSREDMKYLSLLGVDAVLIGETFMRAGSIREKVEELMAYGS